MAVTQSTTNVVKRNRERQATLYGEPLGDLLGRIIDRVGINQARLAAVLGLSAPMLSQLMSGARVQIGNPSAVRRLQELTELAEEAATGIAQPELERRLAEVSSHTSAMTPSTSQRRPAAAGTVRSIQGLLRAIASADELLSAADALQPHHPAIAEFLRIYGAGRTDDAISHYEAREHLV